MIADRNPSTGAIARASAVALVASLLASRALASCPPVALVQGDSGHENEVRELLSRRGVAGEIVPGCGYVEAELETTTEGLRVTIADGEGRRETLTSSDTVTAATFIESWARPDLDSPLLFGRDIVANPAEPADAAPPVANASTAPASPSPPTGPVSALLSLYAARGDDASAWVEPGAAMRVRFGRMLAGATLRGRFDLHASGDSAALDTRRAGVDVLLHVSWPRDMGQVSLRPGIGVGAGWLRSTFAGEEAGGQTVEIDSGGPRLEGHLGVDVALDERTGVDLGLRMVVAPVAHARADDESGITLAGEPLWTLGAGFGLRFGGP